MAVVRQVMRHKYRGFRSAVQALVYSLIAFSAAGLGALAYFGLTFTPANAILVAVVFACACVVLMERVLRQRAENLLALSMDEAMRTKSVIDMTPIWQRFDAALGRGH